MQRTLQHYGINREWTLFLDRDGVLNKHRPDDYVKHWAEWEWIPGSREAIAALTGHFYKIVIITNQRGVGRELMSMDDLQEIHANMMRDVQQAGGRIDAIYAATRLSEDPLNRRKPKPDMAFEARAEFPGIDLSRCIMVGDSDSDMGFGRNAGTLTVRIGLDLDTYMDDPRINFAYPSLVEFARALLRDIRNKEVELSS
jgi:histidinol-phosphate phosphatase family protein